MSMPDDLVFEIGDRVVSRGEKATVTGYRVVDVPGKSNRVTVKWDDIERRDLTEYYARTFMKDDSPEPKYCVTIHCTSSHGSSLELHNERDMSRVATILGDFRRGHKECQIVSSEILDHETHKMVRT